jgi:thiamine phosphate synthase YjbQ (UPF0047 family)
MAAFQQTFEISTRGRGTVDVTGEVARLVRACGIAAGVVHVFVRHTSCSLTITENADPAYRHDLEGDDDMAAHARSVLSGSSVSVPQAGGELLLGTWQGIYLWEHRTAPQRRICVVTVVG